MLAQLTRLQTAYDSEKETVSTKKELLVLQDQYNKKILELTGDPTITVRNLDIAITETKNDIAATKRTLEDYDSEMGTINDTIGKYVQVSGMIADINLGGHYDEITQSLFDLMDAYNEVTAVSYTHLKLIYQLYRENEALVIVTQDSSRKESLHVADSFMMSGYYPTRANEYTGVAVEDETYQKTFYENDVLHFKLNQQNVKKVLDALYQSYYKLMASAMKSYTWGNGRHLKVHISQVAGGKDNFKDEFSEYLNNLSLIHI